MASHSSILAWRIPWTEEPCGLYGPQRHKKLVITEATQHTHIHTRPTAQPALNECVPNYLGWLISLFEFFRKMEQKNPHEIFGQPNIFLLKTLLCLPQKSIASRNSLTRDTLSCSVILFYGSQVLLSLPQRSFPIEHWYQIYSITDSMNRNLSKLQEIVEDRGAWHAIVHEVAKSWTQLTD